MSKCKSCKVTELPTSYDPWMTLCDECFLLEQGVSYEEYYKWLFSPYYRVGRKVSKSVKYKVPKIRKKPTTVTKVEQKPKSKPLYRLYREVVDLLTCFSLEAVPNIELRGYLTYHVDHKISSVAGFILGIAPEDIAHQDNLRMLEARENKRKGMSSYVDNLNSWILLKYGLSESDLDITLSDLRRCNNIVPDNRSPGNRVVSK